jgi:hypothetical protein
MTVKSCASAAFFSMETSLLIRRGVLLLSCYYLEKNQDFQTHHRNLVLGFIGWIRLFGASKSGEVEIGNE